MFGELKVQLRNESLFVEVSEVCSGEQTFAQNGLNEQFRFLWFFVVVVVLFVFCLLLLLVGAQTVVSLLQTTQIM